MAVLGLRVGTECAMANDLGEDEVLVGLGVELGVDVERLPGGLYVHLIFISRN